MNNLDDKIKSALEDNINITESDKNQVWKKIESELYSNKNSNFKRINFKRRSFINLVATVAVIAILFVGAKTKVGHAIVTQIKDLFVPEKQITQEIEGEKEKTNMNLHQSLKSNYIIYVDEERYEFIDGEEVDKIIMKDKPDNIPEVSMDIQQLIDRSPEDVIKDLELQIQGKYEIVHGPETIREPINGFTIRALSGQKWDSSVIKIYVLSNEQQGSFIITQHYFLEAAEGHGVRFDEMVKEFKIVK